MTPANGAPAPAAEAAGPHEVESEADTFRRQVDDLVSKTDVLEKRVKEVVDFYDGKKHGSGGRKGGGGGRHGAYSRGMPDLMRQFGLLLKEITSHKDAWPFLEPVDVVTLQLPDYHKIITQPMDFSTIQKKMERKDGTCYTNVREICSDVRLIFANAMKYNDDQNVIHLMAKSLLEKFEEKWLHFLPKAESEEKRQKEEESKGGVAATNTSREVAIAKLAKDTDDESSCGRNSIEEGTGVSGQPSLAQLLGHQHRWFGPQRALGPGPGPRDPVARPRLGECHGRRRLAHWPRRALRRLRAR